jgi:beta-glucanase (GH16 family)
MFLDGWMGGWMGGWVDGWVGVKAALRIAYSNQQSDK